MEALKWGDTKPFYGYLKSQQQDSLLSVHMASCIQNVKAVSTLEAIIGWRFKPGVRSFAAVPNLTLYGHVVRQRVDSHHQPIGTL